VHQPLCLQVGGGFNLRNFPRPQDASLPRAAHERSQAPRVQPHRTSGVGPVLSEAIARVDEAKTQSLQSQAATNHRLRFQVGGGFSLRNFPRPKDASALPKAASSFCFLLNHCVRRTPPRRAPRLSGERLRECMPHRTSGVGPVLSER
jgi:hypothetical protein